MGQRGTHGVPIRCDRCLGAVGKKLQVLPLEAARVFIGGVKQTTDLAKGLCDSIGRTNSLAHYKEKGKFDEATFESIDFKPVKMVLASKPSSTSTATSGPKRNSRSTYLIPTDAWAQSGRSSRYSHLKQPVYS